MSNGIENSLLSAITFYTDWTFHNRHLCDCFNLGRDLGLDLGGQILTPRRNCLSDEHFEMLLLLRATKDI